MNNRKTFALINELKNHLIKCNILLVKYLAFLLESIYNKFVKENLNKKKSNNNSNKIKY